MSAETELNWKILEYKKKRSVKGGKLTSLWVPLLVHKNPEVHHLPKLCSDRGVVGVGDGVALHKDVDNVTECSLHPPDK